MYAVNSWWYKRQWQRLGLLFGMLLVLGQTAGLVHASIHPFHAEEHGHAKHHDHSEHETHFGHFSHIALLLHVDHGSHAETFEGVSCDVFDNLAQPFAANSSALNVDECFSTQLWISSAFQALSIKSHIDHFYGRAPPVFPNHS